METNRCLVFYLLAVVLAKAECQCHVKNCFCVAGIVSCSSLSEFPTSFPVDTKTITIRSFDTQEIPENAFSNLPVLESIEIFSGNISKISSNAFTGLSDFDRISLGKVNIGTIEHDAFNDLSDFGTLSFYMSTIEIIETRAFSNIFALDTFQLFSSNVSKIQTGAFYNFEEVIEFSIFSNDINVFEQNSFFMIINLIAFEMHLNNIEEIGCGVLEHAITNSEKSSIYSNVFTCNCHVSKLVKDSRFKKHMYSNSCTNPNSGSRLDLNELSYDEQACDTIVSACDHLTTSDKPGIESVTTAQTEWQHGSEPLIRTDITRRELAMTTEFYSQVDDQFTTRQTWEEQPELLTAENTPKANSKEFITKGILQNLLSTVSQVQTVTKKSSDVTQRNFSQPDRQNDDEGKTSKIINVKTTDANRMNDLKNATKPQIQSSINVTQYPKTVNAKASLVVVRGEGDKLGVEIERGTKDAINTKSEIERGTKNATNTKPPTTFETAHRAAGDSQDNYVHNGVASVNKISCIASFVLILYVCLNRAVLSFCEHL